MMVVTVSELYQYLISIIFYYPLHLKVVEKPHIMQMISVMMITIMKNVALMGVTVVDLMLIINTVHIVSVANMRIVMLHTH